MRAPGPKIFPASVDIDDGSVSATQVAVFLTYSQETDDAIHIRAYNRQLECVLDEEVTHLTVGHQPSLNNGRHVLDLPDGRQVLVREDGGCGCGSKLRGFSPGGLPATSGYRP